VKKTYHGSCHCGAVRFEADLDLSAETSRCNCSFCRKGRFWKAIARADEFRLLAGSEMRSEYTITGRITHCFCRRCGIKPFGRGHMEALGGTFYGINLACLDDATDAELAEAPLIFQDGRHDDWQHPPAETRYL
jgi:hypothetical protein